MFCDPIDIAAYLGPGSVQLNSNMNQGAQQDRLEGLWQLPPPRGAPLTASWPLSLEESIFNHSSPVLTHQGGEEEDCDCDGVCPG